MCLFRVSLAIPKDADGNYKRCEMYDVNFKEMLEKNIRPDPSWPIAKCKHGWEYNFTDIPYPTVATDVSSNNKLLNSKNSLSIFIFAVRLGLR